MCVNLFQLFSSTKLFVVPFHVAQSDSWTPVFSLRSCFYFHLRYKSFQTHNRGFITLHYILFSSRRIDSLLYGLFAFRREKYATYYFGEENWKLVRLQIQMVLLLIYVLLIIFSALYPKQNRQIYKLMTSNSMFVNT